jgi:putative glutamine amidotransferase
MRLRTAGYPAIDPFGIFNSVENIDDASTLTKDDCLLLWGGMDVGTMLYDQHANSFCNQHEPSARDLKELEMLHKAVSLDIPIIGICRGAQLMTVFTGGHLIQHVSNHGRSHTITCHDTGEVIRVNSAHHQVCQPIHPAVILASADGTVGHGEFSVAEKLPEVPEVIHFPQIRGIGIQYHPEWTDCPQSAVDYGRDCIMEYIINENVILEVA